MADHADVEDCPDCLLRESEPGIIMGAKPKRHDPENLLYRVHIAGGGPTLRRHEDGFTAKAHQFRRGGVPLTEVELQQHMCRSVWAESQPSPDVRKAVLAHVNGRVESEFISTTRNPNWAVWLTAHLLALGAKSVWISVIHQTGASEASGLNRDAMRDGWMVFDAEKAISMSPSREGLFDGSSHERDARERGINFADASSEVLFYGRIFASKIEETTRWTKNMPHWLDQPFMQPLFESTFKPEIAGSWLYHLSFDPGNSWAESRRSDANPDAGIAPRVDIVWRERELQAKREHRAEGEVLRAAGGVLVAKLLVISDLAASFPGLAEAIQNISGGLSIGGFWSLRRLHEVLVEEVEKAESRLEQLVPEIERIADEVKESASRMGGSLENYVWALVEGKDRRARRRRLRASRRLV